VTFRTCRILKSEASSLIVFLGDGDQNEGTERDPNLSVDGVWCRAIERLDVQVELLVTASLIFFVYRLTLPQPKLKKINKRQE